MKHWLLRQWRALVKEWKYDNEQRLRKLHCEHDYDNNVYCRKCGDDYYLSVW